MSGGISFERGNELVFHKTLSSWVDAHRETSQEGLNCVERWAVSFGYRPVPLHYTPCVWSGALSGISPRGTMRSLHSGIQWCELLLNDPLIILMGMDVIITMQIWVHIIKSLTLSSKAWLYVSDIHVSVSGSNLWCTFLVFIHKSAILYQISPIPSHQLPTWWSKLEIHCENLWRVRLLRYMDTGVQSYWIWIANVTVI